MTPPNDEQRPQLDYMTSGATLFGGRSPQKILRPLWFILVGGLLSCISVGLTLKLSGQHDWTLRFSSQPIGAALLAVGVWQLSWIDLDPDYTRLMIVIFAVAVLQVVKTVADIFPPAKDPVVALFRAFLDLAYVAAAIAFCSCMSWLCRDIGLGRSANAWRKAFVVFFICSIPLVILDCIVLLAVLKIVQVDSVQYHSAGFSWSWWYLLPVPFIVGPPLALAFCIRQMSREMSRRSGRDPGITVAVSPFLPSPQIEAVPESESDAEGEPVRGE
jgi:hypothetical protein